MAKKTERSNQDRLLSFIERIERLQVERKALQEDITIIFSEAKSVGFDPKVMRAMIKERAMDPAVQEEWQALLDIYRAALGMLAGTELGAAARKRLMRPSPDEPASPPDKPPATGGGDGPNSAEGSDASAAPPAPGAPVAPTAEDITAARAQGAAAVKAGRPVTDNPFPAGDLRRAAWDEGWCAASSSDGMDIPDAWRRSKPKGGKPAGAGPGE